MIKNSNLSGQHVESCGWWNHSSKTLGEWAYEGGRKRKQVATDGDRARYPDGLYLVQIEWMIYVVNLDGTAGLTSLVP